MTKCRAWSGFKLFDTLMVFLKDFFEKVNLKKKNLQTTKKHAELPSMQRVKNIHAATWENVPSDMCCQWRLKSACVFAAWSDFVAHMIELCILGYPECTQWWFWSDCSNAQADLYLRWVCMCEGMFADNLELNCFHLFQYSNNGRMSVSIYGPKVIKLFSCSTQLSMKFSLLIKMKISATVFLLFFFLLILSYLSARKTLQLLVIYEIY